MSANPTRYDLEDRLIRFAVSVIDVVEVLPSTKTGNHIGSQLIRSGTSPAPNYGEAQSAESRRDFIHKIKIILKELRETRIWLKIILRKNLFEPLDAATVTLTECDELIRIFAKSAKTAESNLVRERPDRTHPSIFDIEYSIFDIPDAGGKLVGDCDEQRKTSNIEYSISNIEGGGNDP